MTMNLLARRMLPIGLVAAGLLAIHVPALVADAAHAQDTKSIFVTVLDAQGNAVTDLRADEVQVRELGHDDQPFDREIVGIRKAPQPMAIMLLADTSMAAGGTGMMTRQETTSGAAELIRDVRVAFTGFVRTMAAASPETRMELMEFGQAAVPVQRMTSNIAALEKGINRLFPKPDAHSVLLEAINEAAKTLSKVDTPRRIIVALNVLPANEQSRQNPNQMLQQVINSGASVWAVSLHAGTIGNDSRGVVLDALARNTGGRREMIVGQAALELHMKAIANNLAAQYEVTFRRTPGPEMKMILFGVARQGLSLHTSIYPPK